MFYRLTNGVRAYLGALARGEGPGSAGWSRLAQWTGGRGAAPGHCTQRPAHPMLSNLFKSWRVELTGC